MIFSLVWGYVKLDRDKKDSWSEGLTDFSLELAAEPKQSNSRIVYFIPVTCQTLCQRGNIKMSNVQ